MVIVSGVLLQKQKAKAESQYKAAGTGRELIADPEQWLSQGQMDLPSSKDGKVACNKARRSFRSNAWGHYADGSHSFHTLGTCDVCQV